jgi:hypothetical protein
MVVLTCAEQSPTGNLQTLFLSRSLHGERIVSSQVITTLRLLHGRTRRTVGRASLMSALTARRSDAAWRGVSHSIRSLIHVSKFINAINTRLMLSGLLRAMFTQRVLVCPVLRGSNYHYTYKRNLFLRMDTVLE